MDCEITDPRSDHSKEEDVIKFNKAGTGGWQPNETFKRGGSASNFELFPMAK